MTYYSTFTGPDGQTQIAYQHGSECDCAVCETAQWERIERENSKQSYGVYGLNEQDDCNDKENGAFEMNTNVVESNFWTVFFSIVAMWAAITTDCLSEEMDDPDNIANWNAALTADSERYHAVPVHTEEHPHCLMSDCPCHDDEALWWPER